MTEMVLMVVGDVMLGRGVEGVIEDKGIDFPFLHVKDMLTNADIVFGVLDSPVSLKGIANPDKPKDFPKIKCRPEALDGLKNTHFKIMHIGTNHILDFGSEGLEETVKHLDERGIRHIGAGKSIQEARKPTIITKDGIFFGFLGYCLSYPASSNIPGCAPLKLDIIREDIQKLRGKVSFLIVSLHHGIEYSFYPYPEYIDLVHSLVDAGADIILGHHPHVLQGYERYKKGFIIYSLGNFVFDKDDTVRDTKKISRIRLKLEKNDVIAEPNTEKFYESVILKVAFQDNSIKSIEFMPVCINNEFQPVLAHGVKRDIIIDFLNVISSNLHKKNLWFYRDLSRLYAEENVDILLKGNIWKIVSRLHKIRPRHVKHFISYFHTKIKDNLSRGK